MSLKITEKTPEKALEDFLDSIYLRSHSTQSVKAYKSAIGGSEHGFRLFLRERYNCDEIQFLHRIKNEELDVYEILRVSGLS